MESGFESNCKEIFRIPILLIATGTDTDSFIHTLNESKSTELSFGEDLFKKVHEQKALTC